MNASKALVKVRQNKWLKITIITIGLACGVALGIRRSGNGTFQNSLSVYGCGVDKKVELERDEVIQLWEIISQISDIPPRVTHVVLETERGHYFIPIDEAAIANGSGTLPIFGGERVLLMQVRNEEH